MRTLGHPLCGQPAAGGYHNWAVLRAVDADGAGRGGNMV